MHQEVCGPAENGLGIARRPTGRRRGVLPGVAHVRRPRQRQPAISTRRRRAARGRDSVGRCLSRVSGPDPGRLRRRRRVLRHLRLPDFVGDRRQPGGRPLQLPGVLPASHPPDFSGPGPGAGQLCGRGVVPAARRRVCRSGQAHRGRCRLRRQSGALEGGRLLRQRFGHQAAAAPVEPRDRGAVLLRLAVRAVGRVEAALEPLPRNGGRCCSPRSARTWRWCEPMRSRTSIHR